MREMFKRQREFTAGFLKSKGINLDSITHEQRVQWSKEYILMLHRELDEVLDNLDWKQHKARDFVVHESGLLEELVDVQKFLWALTAISGYSSTQFEESFDRKSFVVDERWRCEQSEIRIPGLACDVDNVIFRHTESFTAWLKDNHPELLAVSKGRNPLEWEVAKHEYRASGAKRHGEADTSAIEVLRELKKIGWSIVLITYRPRKLYPSLEYDTLRWLVDNSVPFDKIYWADSSKALFFDQLLKNCSAFVDDDYETCTSVASVGRKTYWLTDKESNTPRVTAIKSLDELFLHEYGRRYERSKV